MYRCSSFLLGLALASIGSLAGAQSDAEDAAPALARGDASAQPAALTDVADAGDAADQTAARPPIGSVAPASRYPMLLGAQYTYILQQQSDLHAPYSGPLSLDPNGDTQPSNTVGAYGGWQPVSWDQLYLTLRSSWVPV